MDYLDQVAIARHASWAAFDDLAADAGPAPDPVSPRAATASYLDHGYRPDDILMFGRESAGVPDAVHAAADARLVIPMRPGLRSINVAMVAAMALGEAMRQTGGVRPMNKIGQMASPLPDAATLDARKDRAPGAWFESLRDDICAAFETVEDALPAGAPPAESPGRPFQAHALAAHRSHRQPGRRRRHVDDAAAGCSRRSACIARPCMASSRRSSARKFPAPMPIRASGRPASR